VLGRSSQPLSLSSRKSSAGHVTKKLTGKVTSLSHFAVDSQVPSGTMASMNYEFFFAQRDQKEQKFYRVYSASPEIAVLILAEKLGCKTTSSVDAEKFLSDLDIQRTRLETVFGEGQPWTESQHVRVHVPPNWVPSFRLLH
jgi:hypothetical protein